MSNLLNVIFENEVLREKVKILLVEHRYYKEARDLMENKNEGIFNAINPKATVWESPETYNPTELADFLTKFSKKQLESKKDIYSEMFRDKAIKVTK